MKPFLHRFSVCLRVMSALRYVCFKEVSLYLNFLSKKFSFNFFSQLTFYIRELASVFEAETDHSLGLLKVKAGNLRGI